MDNQLDSMLSDWPFDPDRLNVRETTGLGGRPVLQMRIDLGILQLEIDGRPDGERPSGKASFYDSLVDREEKSATDFALSDDDYREIDREFVQYYHRRICWLKLQRYELAAMDADHTLLLMDFCRRHSDDEHWTMTHEQYRPFVLFHRTQAAAMAELESDGLDSALAEIDHGLLRLQEFFAALEIEDQYEEDLIVIRLREFRDALREQNDNTFGLREALKSAIATEQFERAAELRDEIQRKRANP
ncbi:MAG: UvrB/UvrC motif-containing protein [Pirellulaceae bacterium]